MNYINPKSTVACILVKNYKILLAKRVKNPFKNYWCLPGGHVKLFEKIENAIKREIKEELNIKIKPKLFTFDQEVYKNLKWHANVFFFVSKLNGHIKINKSELSNYKFFSNSEIKSLKIAFNHKKILLKFFKNAKH